MEIQRTTFQRILKNIFIQILTQIIDVGGIAVLYIFMARVWGPEKFGIYSYIVAITSILLFACDLGLNVLLVRNVAREKENVGQYFHNSFLISIVLSIFIFLGISVFNHVTGYNETIKNGIHLGFLYLVLGVFINLFRGIFFAFEKMEYEILGKTIEKTLALILGGWGLYSGFGIPLFFFMLCLSRLGSLTYYCLLYHRKFNLQYQFEIDLNFLRRLVKEAWPFGLNILLTSLYLQNGVLFLTSLAGEREAGYFKAVLNFLLPLSVAIESMNMAFMPNLSQWYLKRKEKIVFVMEKVTLISIIISVPVSIILFLFSEEIILVIYGNSYQSSGLILKLVAVSIIFRILKNFYAVVLTSINRQRERTISVGIGTFMTILLNFYLIKKYSFVGAAVASVLGEIITFFGIYYFLRRSIPFTFLASFVNWRKI